MSTTPAAVSSAGRMRVPRTVVARFMTAEA